MTSALDINSTAVITRDSEGNRLSVATRNERPTMEIPGTTYDRLLNLAEAVAAGNTDLEDLEDMAADALEAIDDDVRKGRHI